MAPVGDAAAKGVVKDLMRITRITEVVRTLEVTVEETVGKVSADSLKLSNIARSAGAVRDLLNIAESAARKGQKDAARQAFFKAADVSDTSALALDVGKTAFRHDYQQSAAHAYGRARDLATSLGETMLVADEAMRLADKTVATSTLSKAKDISLTVNEALSVAHKAAKLPSSDVAIGSFRRAADLAQTTETAIDVANSARSIDYKNTAEYAVGRALDLAHTSPKALSVATHANDKGYNDKALAAFRKASETSATLDEALQVVDTAFRRNFNGATGEFALNRAGDHAHSIAQQFRVGDAARVNKKSDIAIREYKRGISQAGSVGEALQLSDYLLRFDYPNTAKTAMSRAHDLSSGMRQAKQVAEYSDLHGNNDLAISAFRKAADHSDSLPQALEVVDSAFRRKFTGGTGDYTLNRAFEFITTTAEGTQVGDVGRAWDKTDFAVRAYKRGVDLASSVREALGLAEHLTRVNYPNTAKYAYQRATELGGR
jgi:tetratricopeptide (TPR) repeat protein